LNSALVRLGYKGIATAHGFRTLFSTCANEAGWSSDVIEKQLAHEERNEVRGAYNRAKWLSDRKELMQWWADRLDELRAAATSSSGSRSSTGEGSGRRGGMPIRQQPQAVQEATSINAGIDRASMPSADAKASLPDPIEVLRALVAVFDQAS